LARHRAGTFDDAIKLGEKAITKANFFGFVPFPYRANVEPCGPTNDQLRHRFFASA
jgi:hypothetical protein